MDPVTHMVASFVTMAVVLVAVGFIVHAVKKTCVVSEKKDHDKK